MSHTEAIERLSIEASSLMAGYRPRFLDANKELLFALACPAGCRHSGVLHASRWPARELPKALTRSAALDPEARPGFFDYPDSGAGSARWHLNFADPNVFGYGMSGLFAQDEMQIGEHPALGALRERLGRTSEMTPSTLGPRGEPTPFLVAGVERRVAVATEPDAAEGRPAGLYGNAFAAAEPGAIRRATREIDPPTRVNILAIAAPGGGHGRYGRETIERVLVTAFSGFASARDETTRLLGADSCVVVHTGHWGCGAFGGDRLLMAALQVIAAHAARLDEIVFHAGDEAGCRDFEEARVFAGELLPAGGESVDTRALIDALDETGFRWGEGDGN